MRISVNFASTESAVKVLRKMIDDLEKDGSAQQSFFNNGASGGESIGIEFVDEASTEFDEPTAEILRD